MDAERFIRDLAAALPEAFAGEDLEQEYGPGPGVDAEAGVDEEAWLSYVALGHARMWIEEHALKVDGLRRVARVRAGGEDALRRFFAYVEPLAREPDRDMGNLLMIELFEGVVWTEDVIAYLGPSTVALLRRAQDELAYANRCIGRWAEPPAPEPPAPEPPAPERRGGRRREH